MNNLGAYCPTLVYKMMDSAWLYFIWSVTKEVRKRKASSSPQEKQYFNRVHKLPGSMPLNLSGKMASNRRSNGPDSLPSVSIHKIQ